MGDIAILIPYFNPVGYQSHLRKLDETLQAFGQAGLADDVFLAGAGGPRPSWANVAFWDEECPFLWHKERLLNIGARSLPDSYTHVIWADSDILVGPDWWPAVQAAFRQAPIVQCFNSIVYLTEAGPLPRVRPSALCPGANGAAGVCWGAERSLFSEGPGLFELALVGAGDVVFATELLGVNLMPSVPWLQDHPDLLYQTWPTPLIERMDQWRAAASDWTQGKKAVAAEVAVEVIMHGPNRGRRYHNRQPLLARMDPGRHLVDEPGRVLRWSAEGLAEVEPGIRAYFHQRHEDEPFLWGQAPKYSEIA
jgi:hypothetical protein